MKKIIKWAGVFVTAFLLFWIAVAIVLVVFVNPNSFKPLIIEKVEKSTSYTLSLPGDLHWKFFPSINLQIEKAQLFNAKGSKDQPIASMDQAKIGIRIMPLLYGQVISQIYLEQLEIVQLSFQKVQASLLLEKGLLDLQSIKARCYEGNLKAQLRVNMRSKVPQIKLEGTIASVHIQPFLKDLMGHSSFEGIGYLTLSLSTQSLETQQAIRSLQGHMSFALKDGAMMGLNMLYFIQAGQALLNKLPPPPPVNLNRTDFGNLTGTADIQNGIMTNRDLHLLSKDLEATGQGTINCVNQTINYTFKAFRPSQPGSIVPVKVQGSWKNPSIGLDMGNLLQNVVQQQLEKGQLGQTLKGDLQSSLGRLFSH